jgi:hypothetical protein
VNGVGVSVVATVEERASLIKRTGPGTAGGALVSWRRLQEKLTQVNEDGPSQRPSFPARGSGYGSGAHFIPSDHG